MWSYCGPAVGTKWFRWGTVQVMTVRARIDEETVERLNDELENTMAVEPEAVGVDKKINVLIDELGSERVKRRRAENQANQGEGQFR